MNAPAPTLRPTLSADEVCALLGLAGKDRVRQLRRAVWRGAAPKPLPKAGRQLVWSPYVVEQWLRTNGGKLAITLKQSA